MILLDAMLNAPWVAVRPDDPNLLHAVTMDDIVTPWPDGPYPAACGVADVVLCGSILDGEMRGAPWPPRVATRGRRVLPPSMTRCRACWDATGNKPPRSKFKPRG